MTQRAILHEAIHPEAGQAFWRAGWEVETFPQSVSPVELAELSQDATVLGVRSSPAVPAEVFAENDSLLAIGCFGSGFDHIATRAAAEQGIAVFNSPRENTRAVAQYVVTSAFNLLRRIPEHNTSMHAGIWSKTDRASHEWQAMTVGVVGYGMIGSQVATVLDSVGMRVLYHDLQPKHSTHGRVEEAAGLDDLLERADIVTLHVTGSSGAVLSTEALAKMKPGSYVINASRAAALDMDALVAALDSGHIAGAAIDVFPKDPKSGESFEHPLQGRSNVLLTPHIGGSTEEAQTETGKKTATRLIEYVRTGRSVDSVNIPEIVTAPVPADTTRLTYLHKDQPRAYEALVDAIGDAGLNIELTSPLQRREGIGYVAVDVAGAVTASLLREVESQPANLKLRTIQH